MTRMGATARASIYVRDRTPKSRMKEDGGSEERTEAGTRRLTSRAGPTRWLLLLLAPAVLLVVFFSFALLAAAGLLAVAVLPLLWKRRSAAPDPSVIELDPSDYRRVETRQRSAKE